MAKIDTSGWKEFRVGYLVNNNKKIGTGLFKIVNSVPYHSQDVVENDDGINYVTRSKFNNGVKCKVEKCDNFIINPSGTISFGAENANFFYQHEEYITGNKMYYLDTSDLSKYSALFLQSVLEATFTNNFSFSDGLIPSKIYDEFIKLPVDTNGNPDWEYMEEYMTEVMRESEESIENLKQVSQEKKKVDITEWKEFRVGDLFDVQTTKSLDKLQLEFSDDYEYDFVGRSYVNNGIQGHLKKQSFEPNPANTFSVVQIGEQVCLYRENEWYASQNIFILKPKYKKVKETSFFMSCIITKTIKIKFGDNAYASYPTKNSLIDTAIPLPVDTNGNPDWEYMEEYMTEVMRESEESIENLKQVSQEKKKVDITEWKEFRVGDLFETECSGKKVQVPTGAWVPTKLLQNGVTPRITVSGINNGIVGYYSDIENDNYRVYNNFISVSFLGTVFYQSGRASLDMKVHCLKPVDIVLTDAIAEFLVTAIRNAIQQYAYQDQLSSTVLSTVKVILPVDSDGNPDWEYMEEYMSAIMKESEDNLTNLSLIL